MGLLVVGILWVYTSLIAGPLLREVRGLGQRVRDARQELRVLEAATANEAALREQHRQLQEDVTALRDLLPDEEELPQLIELLSNLASQSQVKIQTIFPQRPSEGSATDQDPDADLGPTVYKDVLIQIDAITGFHQLGVFLSLVEARDVPMQVSFLRISSHPREIRRVKVKLLMHAFFAAEGAGDAS
ncbi:MAG: type 4a pilus biogenesis protein PilO [Acidobacteriota bacterium]